MLGGEFLLSLSLTDFLAMIGTYPRDYILDLADRCENITKEDYERLEKLA